MPHSTLVEVATLRAHLDRGDWCIVDCRFSLADPDAGLRAYAAGHLPGAVYAHLERDPSGPVTPVSGRHPLPEVGRLAERLSAWGIDESVQVVAYDDAGGAMAARLWWLLRWLGHRAVALLDGGWQAWCAAGAPVSDRPVGRPATRFRPRPSDGAWLDAAQVQRGLSRGEVLLLDARSEARFRGDEEPIDPVAGHVPGAGNRPYTRNLGADGRFRAPSDLRAELQAELGGRAPGAVVHMCGSGVTACHNLLAMEIAGLSGSRLYPGSWSEWIRDPNRPIATGPAIGGPEPLA